MQTYNEADIKNLIRNTILNRPDDVHKGSMGTLLSICGSYGMPGAAIFAGRAATRCGIGMLKMPVPTSIYPICASNNLVALYYSLLQTENGTFRKEDLNFLLNMQADKSNGVLIGCGLSVCYDTKVIVKSFIEYCEKPMLLDADALNCICDEPEILLKAKAPVIITPHPGEMARLIKSSAQEVNAARIEIATAFAQKYNVITVLKGPGTVVASPDDRYYINSTGNSGMAMGGSGDVLAGMTASILAQGNPPYESAVAGVYLHGLAGDIAAEKFGKTSMIPTDIIDCIHLAIKQCEHPTYEISRNIEKDIIKNGKKHKRKLLPFFRSK